MNLEDGEKIVESTKYYLQKSLENWKIWERLWNFVEKACNGNLRRSNTGLNIIIGGAPIDIIYQNALYNLAYFCFSLVTLYTQ